MLEIRAKIDVPVKITESTVKSLHINMVTENYGTIRIIHGQEFMKALIDYYSDLELYETCAKMHSQSIEVDKLEKSLFPDGPPSRE